MKIFKRPDKKILAAIRDNLSSFAFYAPSFFIYTAFLVLPALLGLFYSFTSWNGVSSKISFIGLANYIEVFTDKRFIHSILNTLFIMIIQVVLFNVLGLGLAALMENIIVNKLKQTLRAIYFFPYVISYVVVGTIWIYMLNYKDGVINEILRRIGLGFMTTEVIGNPRLVNLAIAGINVWAFLGFYVVVYMSAMQTIPLSIYESCDIDGGKMFTKFFHITFPLVAPAFTVCLVLSVALGLGTFEPVLVLTQGGPGFASETISYYIYWAGSLSARQGYATAISMVLFLTSLIIAIFQITVLVKREVEY